MNFRLCTLLCILAFLCNASFASVTVSVNGVTHTIPQTNEKGWGSNVTAWIQSISQYTLQPSGGTFTLTAETDLGATYGLKLPYIKTATSTPATAGVVRLAKADVINWRNNANGGNLSLGINASDQLTFNSVVVPTATGASVQDSTFSIYDNVDNTKLVAFQVSGVTAGNTRTLTVPDANTTIVGTDTTQTLTNKSLTAPTLTGTITTGVTASRAVVTGASNELAAATTTATEIGYVNGVTSAIQTQLNTKAPTAGPTFSGTITTPLTASRLMVTGASNELAVNTVTATEAGYLSGVTSAIQTQINSATTSSSNSYKISNCSIATSVGSNNLTIALKDAAGSDASAGSPCTVTFRSATAATGTYSDVSTTGALSLVVSNGSALGCTASAACTLYVYGVNSGSGLVLGVVGWSPFDEGSILTSTAEGGAGAADSAAVLYSTAAQTSKAIRLLARLTITPGASFAWTANSTEISNIPFNGDRSITPWVAYTPTITGFGTVSAVSMEWRKVGQDLEVRGVFTAGTSTGVEAQMTLPSTFVSAAYSSITLAGPLVYSGNLAGSMYNLIEASKTYFTFSYSDTSHAGLAKRNGNDFGSSVSFSVNAKTKVTGW